MIRLLAISILLFSCQSQAEKEAEEKQLQQDSALSPAQIEHLQEDHNSRTKDLGKQIFLDTVGVAAGPIQVKAQIVKEDYGSDRQIVLYYKNISGKAISAIRFKWYVENAFGEPADVNGTEMSIYGQGYGAGEVNDAILPGKSTARKFDLSSKDAKTAVAWPYEIAFEDGTRWKSHKIDSH